MNMMISNPLPDASVLQSTHFIHPVWVNLFSHLGDTVGGKRRYTNTQIQMKGGSYICTFHP